MVFRKIILFSLLFLLSGCALKQKPISASRTIVFKTPSIKFYDSGFITEYRDHIKLEIYNAGNIVLYLDIYKDKICQSAFKCIQAKEFNLKYLHNSYKDDFLYNLFLQNNIYHKDKENKILIKVN